MSTEASSESSTGEESSFKIIHMVASRIPPSPAVDWKLLPVLCHNRLLHQVAQNVAAGFLRARSRKSQRETASKREVGFLPPHRMTFPVLY